MSRRLCSSPTFLSLFSGCGGLDLGFLRAGFTSIGAFELDPDAVATYKANISDTATCFDLTNWSDIINNHDFHPDVVIAGPPCQGFSTVGNNSANDARNRLLTIPAHVAVATGARILVIENVPGALSGPNARYWKDTTHLLHLNDYETQTLIVDAGNTGLPQRRKRAILVAISRKLAPRRWIVPTAQPAPLKNILPVSSNTPNHTPKRLNPTTQAALIAPRIKAGQKLCNVRAGSSAIHTWDIPEVFGSVSKAERSFLETLLRLRRRDRKRSFGDADPVHWSTLRTHIGSDWRSIAHGLINKQYLRTLAGGLYDLRHTFNGKFRRLHPDQPTNCVLTKFCQPNYFLHPHEDRAFTIREAARLQGFADDFIFLGLDRVQARLVGNAVPPPLAELIATWVMDTLR